jgi:hypothetical protein
MGVGGVVRMSRLTEGVIGAFCLSAVLHRVNEWEGYLSYHQTV